MAWNVLYISVPDNDIYFLTASGLPPGGSCTIHIYTQTIHRTTQNKQYLEQHKFWAQHKIWEQYRKFGRVRAVPRLGELYLGNCLTTEEKARKNLLPSSSGQKSCAAECAALHRRDNLSSHGCSFTLLIPTTIYVSVTSSSHYRSVIFHFSL
jgi:hypothetical protein